MKVVRKPPRCSGTYSSAIEAVIGGVFAFKNFGERGFVMSNTKFWF